MSNTHLTTPPETASSVLTALKQAQSITELLAILLDGHRLTFALGVVAGLLDATSALLEREEQRP